MNLDLLSTYFVNTDDEYHLAAQIFVIIFFTMTVNFFLKRFLNRLAIQLEKTKTLWDDALLGAAYRPLRLFVWVMGLSVAAILLQRLSGENPSSTEAAFFALVTPIRQVAVIVLSAWFLNGFIWRAEKNVIDPNRLAKPMDDTTASAVAKLLRMSVIITAALVVLQTLGYSVSGVLAFGGIGGMAVGFAAKDMLANFFGGLMIYMDRPFSVGDWVRSPDRSIEGTVEDIGWRLTRIRTFDKRPLYIPNATFTSVAVENPSRMTHRRIYETIGIRYDDVKQLPAIIEDVKQMLIEHDEIASDQTLIVNFNSYAASSLDFFVYTFTKTTNWIKFHEVKQDVLLKIMKIVEKHNAEFAFPTSTLHVASLPEGAGEMS